MIKEDMFIPLTYDKLFVSVFGNEEYIDILEILLEDVFDYPRGLLKGRVALKHRDLPTINKRHAKKQVDIVAEVDKNFINLELNNNFNRGIKERNIVYLSAIHGTQLKKINDSYNNIGKSTLINLNRGHNLKYTVEPYIFVNIKNIDYMINQIDNISIIMVDLEKGKKYNRGRIDRWCTLLLASNQKEFLESLKRIEMERELKDKLKEKVEVFNEDEEEIAIYSNYTREELEHNTELEDARDEGESKGKIEGKIEKAQETAKAMLEKGYSLEEIKDITGLSLEEIEKLR